MLKSVLAGQAVTAGELARARAAGVSRSGANAHLRKLREGGLILEEVVGRRSSACHLEHILATSTGPDHEHRGHTAHPPRAAEGSTAAGG